MHINVNGLAYYCKCSDYIQLRIKSQNKEKKDPIAYCIISRAGKKFASTNTVK